MFQSLTEGDGNVVNVFDGNIALGDRNTLNRDQGMGSRRLLLLYQCSSLSIRTEGTVAGRDTSVKSIQVLLLLDGPLKHATKRLEF